MRLSKFIRENRERILEEWENFASRLRIASDEMDKQALRDSVREMLQFIADDLESPRKSFQRREQEGTSWRESSHTAAEAHGGDRMRWGFGINDVLAEFLALRASVIRLWGGAIDHMEQDDLLRFNAAIDQSLMDSIRSYTNQKERQTRLLEAMLSWSSDQNCILDTKGRVLYANSAMARPYGMRAQDMEGKRVDELDSTFAEEVHAQTGNILSTGRETRGDFTISTPRGDVHVIEYLFAPILDADNAVEAIAINARDVSEHKAWERTLWKHANHDRLTGVPNRRLLMDRLEQDIRMARRAGGLLALLYIDLDKFKEANDHLGHDAGDLLLKQAAERIASCIRETDTVARMGGDEFTVILMDVGDRRRVEAVARAILTRLSRPYSIGDQVAQLGGSIGVALYPEHGESVDDLLASADRAMYSAKQAGGDRMAFFAPEDPARMRLRGRIAGERRHSH